MALVPRQPWAWRQLIPSLLLPPLTAIFWRQFDFPSPWQGLRTMSLTFGISYVYFILIRWVVNLKPVPPVQVTLPNFLDRFVWILPYKIFFMRIGMLSAMEAWCVMQFLGHFAVKYQSGALGMAGFFGPWPTILLLHFYTVRNEMRMATSSEAA